MASHPDAGGFGESFGSNASPLSTTSFTGQIDDAILLSDGLASDDQVFDYVNCVSAQTFDYGDAPASYGDARHITTFGTGIFLGSQAPDSETGTQSNTAADGDDTTASPDDEDAFSSFPNLYSDETNYSLSVSCVGSSAVSAWIDFNNSNAFDAAEIATATCSSSSATLNWSGLSGLSASTTYLRIRTASSSFEIQNPTGSASDGEVEDYRITILPAPTATSAPTICGPANAFIQTFGTGASPTTTLPSGVSTSFAPYVSGDGSDYLDDGEYVLLANPGTPGAIDDFGANTDIWHHSNDHTGDSNGYMLLVNGDSSSGDIFRQTFNNLVIGTEYSFNMYVTNIFRLEASGGTLLPNMTLTAEPVGGGTSSSTVTGDIARTTTASGAAWLQFSVSFTATTNRYDLVVTDNTSSGSGNDFALDDMSLELTCVGADLVINKTVDTSSGAIGTDITDADNSGNVTPGDTITFRMTVTNNGPLDATNITVTDIVPAGYSYASSSISGGDSRSDANPTSSGLTWTINNLTAGNNTAVTFQATVLETSTFVDYSNTASVTSSVFDDIASNNSSSTTPDILRITKYVCNESTEGDSTCSGADFVFSVSGSPGDTLVYRIEYENFATEVVDFDFSDSVPVFTTIVEDSYGASGEVFIECHANGSVGSIELNLGLVNTVTADITNSSVCNGSILPNESGAIMFKATVN